VNITGPRQSGKTTTEARILFRKPDATVQQIADELNYLSTFVPH
jgi:predicted AAA+ superfamily ATPase